MAREQYETTWKDYYAILQVHPEAEPEVISAAYRRLALMYHPDRNHSPEAERKFKDINEANEVLSDPARRVIYDLAYIRYQSGGSQQARYGGSRRSSRQAKAETGRSSHNYQSHDSDDEWYDEGFEWEGQPATHSAHTYNPFPHSLFSFAFLRYLMTKLLDKLAPFPDESQRILPWPSWQWQRISLMGAPVLASLSFLFALVDGAWEVVVFALLFLGASIYAARTTDWLRDARDAPRAARIAGGACVVLSGVSWGLGVAYGIFAILMIIFFFRAMGMLLMAMLEGRLNRRR